LSAKVIAVANQKGGSGKTTLSMQLGGSLAKRGYKILIVDADKQATATRWATADEKKTFPCTVIGLSAADSRVHREVQKFIDDYDFIIIDCPPSADSKIPRSALLIADLVLTPIIPSPLDLWSAVGIREVIEDASVTNEDMIARLVINQCQPNLNLTRDIMDILQEFRIPILKTKLGQRTVYRQSAVYGSIVHDFGTKAEPAIKEVESLTDEVLSIFNTLELE
jgi:chromosome partitioning protein